MSLWRTPRTRALLVVAILGGLWGIAAVAARVYTDLLWFSEVGQPDVYWTTLAFRVLPVAFVGLATTVALLANAALVVRRTRSRHPAPHSLGAIACGALSVVLRPADGWELLALWAHRTPFGTRDPIFHKDAAFYVFTLPLERALANWALELVVMAAVLTAGGYALEHKARRAQRHLFALGAVAALVIAWRFRLDQYALVLPHEGSVVPGASHTDIHARLPILRAFTVLALIGGTVCAFAALRPVRLIRLAIPAGLVAIAAAAITGLPGVIERLDVAPQALAREREYVAYAIESTRRAFALDTVEVRTTHSGRGLDRATLAEHRDTIDNVPLWDPSVLRPAMNETQSIGGYYSFATPTIDRYDGSLWTLAPRRLDLRHLSRDALGWANVHFAYTHGYGVVAVRGGEADEDRYPRFAQREFGGDANPLALAQPRVYFGERSRGDPEYTILDSHRAEVEQPAPGSRPPAYHYDGTGGIPLSSLIRRVAFAIRFDDLGLALTETLGAESRIAVRRDVRERVETLAPFLEWDRRPQTVVAGGRVQYLLHGYTSSASFPYSARFHGVNYLRAPALAVVDAFDGTTTLYALEPDEPILRAWSKLYPGLFAARETLPAGLRAHVRYPEELFAAQAEIYENYHAENATGFWNGSDHWRQAEEFAGPVEDAGEIHFPDPNAAHITPPSFLLARLPGDRESRLMLTQSYTPRGHENLVAYLTGSMDASLTPRLTVLSLPRDRLTTGPTQATRQILASPGVDRTLQVLNRESADLGRASINRTVLGRPRIVPIGDELVIVQPVYVTAGGSGFPRLQLVTVFANGRVGYGRDLARALASATAP